MKKIAAMLSLPIMILSCSRPRMSTFRLPGKYFGAQPDISQ